MFQHMVVKLSFGHGVCVPIPLWCQMLHWCHKLWTLHTSLIHANTTTHLDSDKNMRLQRKVLQLHTLKPKTRYMDRDTLFIPNIETKLTTMSTYAMESWVHIHEFAIRQSVTAAVATSTANVKALTAYFHTTGTIRSPSNREKTLFDAFAKLKRRKRPRRPPKLRREITFYYHFKRSHRPAQQPNQRRGE